VEGERTQDAQDARDAQSARDVRDMRDVDQAPALLEARGARVAVDDVVALDHLTCVARGDRVLCLGDTQGLLAVLTGVPLLSRGRREPGEPPGEARVVAGSLALGGRDVARGAHRPLMGAAPLDPPLPGGWTADEYVAWSARLGGASARAARDLAAAALGRVGLGAARRRKIGALAAPERRALVVAAAVALSPPVVVLEDPLSGLDGAAAAFVLSAVAGATEGRRALVSAGRVDVGGPAGALVRGATDVLVLAAGELAFQGSAADLSAGRRVYTLTVRTGAEALREALAARGLDLRGGPARFSVALPEGASTREIIAAAAAARAPVLELAPVL